MKIEDFFYLKRLLLDLWRAIFTSNLGMHHFQETLLLEPMFEVPGSDISTVIVTEESVKGKAPATYIRTPRSSENEPEEDSGV